MQNPEIQKQFEAMNKPLNTLDLTRNSLPNKEILKILEHLISQNKIIDLYHLVLTANSI